jgi:hypothetical protein
MRKRTLAVVGSAVGLGLVLTVTLIGTANAGPITVKGLTTNVVTVTATATANSVTQAEAACAPDQLMTGGGFQEASVGHDDKVFINAPLDTSTWLVEVVNDSGFDFQYQAYAICLGKA